MRRRRNGSRFAPYGLSPREAQVLGWLSQGIGLALELSTRTMQKRPAQEDIGGECGIPFDSVVI